MFTGQFYNHQVAKSTTITVLIVEAGLLLQVPGAEEGVIQPVYWLFADMQPDLVDRSFIRIIHRGADAGTLEVNDPAFVKTFLQYYKPSRITRLEQLVVRGGLKWSLGIVLVMIALLLVGNFVVLPWCAGIAAERLPHSFDRQLGEMARNSNPEPVDTAASALLTAFARQIQWDTRDTLTFVVSRRDIENAYALPGGYMVVYTGLLKKLKTPEQLAALLSHEVAHVTCRHSIRALCSNMSSMLLINLIFSGGGTLTGQLFSNAASLNSLRYSRKYEEQADLTGLATLRENHINQQGMLALMEALQQLDHQHHIPEFISTHPLTDHRVRYVQQQIAEHPATAMQHPAMATLFQQLKEASR
ncbi:peptidase M48-like protein [Chitinophaga polysaccharea]|uniref:Peptidase M48-like protein n=1 Tax=Chitinophaga polysaccharea TaxID=1293035 RepID=A0A561PAY1_9BACT|nr:M48 family metallopeptidase [Chitinophaga polysaccharea]TWF35269.1 peptidase M48-like protein [Chitinophaga polysaccharea]